jgi:hypothetical protein
MNDNHTPTPTRPKRPRLFVIVGGFPPLPDPCFCGSEAVFVDGETVTPRRARLFVSCAHCGAQGPDAMTYDEAVAAWNALTDNPAFNL